MSRAIFVCGLGFCLLTNPTWAAEDHTSSDIAYIACDGTNQGPEFRAYWKDDGFRHVDETTKAEHLDTVLNYLTWDGSCWQASWDAKDQQFMHKRFPGGGDQHADKILNYLTFDRSLWSATRTGDDWFHVYIAPKDPGPSKNVFAQVDHWLDRNKKTVEVVKVVYDALKKMSDENKN